MSNIPRNVAWVQVVSSMTVISPCAFEQCNGLTEVEICDSVQKIGNNAFSAYCSLKIVRVPLTVTQIGAGEFDYGSVQEMDLCKGLKKIGVGTFRECFWLKIVEIPSTVGKIPKDAFCECSILMDVKLNKGIKEIGRNFVLRHPVLRTDCIYTETFFLNTKLNVLYKSKLWLRMHSTYPLESSKHITMKIISNKNVLLFIKQTPRYDFQKKI